LPWFHLVTLLTKVDDGGERTWLASQAIQQGWSRATLQVHIKNRLFERQGQAITNFEMRLPATQAALAQESLKDPYFFDFLGLGEEAQERDIESALVRHITRFLLELGAGFAFVGRQYRLEVGGEEFFIDLLFYHTRLKCYVVVELSGVTRLGVDETAARRGHDYITLVTDMDERRLLFATEGRGHHTLGAFREDLEAHHGKAEQILEACIDMSPSFIKGSERTSQKPTSPSTAFM
jgi:predicted nuclease of restriction endonuclease-like (RecB) superfamily